MCCNGSDNVDESQDIYNITIGGEINVYRYDLETKQLWVWCFEDEVRTTNQSEEELKCWEENGHIFLLKKGPYCNYSARQPSQSQFRMVYYDLPSWEFSQWKAQHPRWRCHLLLHQGNVSAHNTARTVDFFERTWRFIAAPPKVFSWPYSCNLFI